MLIDDLIVLLQNLVNETLFLLTDHRRFRKVSCSGFEETVAFE